MKDLLLTVDECADILRVSSKTVYRHATEIPGYIKIVGSIRFNREILLKSLARPPKKENGGSDNHDRHAL